MKRKIILKLHYKQETRRLILRKSNDETWLHILIKILAYIFFWEDSLLIEPDFHYRGYKPDLLRMDPGSNPKQIGDIPGLWVECKNVKLQKLDDLVRYTNSSVYWFHLDNYLDRVLTSRNYQKYPRLEFITTVGIASVHLSSLKEELSYGKLQWMIEELESGIKIYTGPYEDSILVKFHSY